MNLKHLAAACAAGTVMWLLIIFVAVLVFR